MEEPQNDNTVDNVEMQCTNCLQLNQELLNKQTQRRKQEKVIRSAHEKAVVTLESSLRKEQGKCDEVERELEAAKND